MKLPPIERTLVALSIAEVATPIALFLLQPGFDKKNSLGLDFDFVVQMGWLFLALWTVGMIQASRYRKTRSRYFYGHLFASPIVAGILLGFYCLYVKK